MKVELKTWGTLGLATALMGAGLAGCAGEGGEGGEAAQTSQTGEAGEGEGGEGEAGEGGVSVGDAASDPVEYLAALAVVEAHVIAAHDAFLAGNTEAAAQMFAHPVSEVLMEMDPVFEKLGTEDMKPLLNDASAAAIAGENAEQIGKRYEAIIAALRAAAEKAPDNGTSEGIVAASVISDMLERANLMYGEAVKHDTYEQYLDGYGFFKAGAAAFEESGSAIKSEDPALYARIDEALELYGKAYPGAKRPAKLDASQGAMSGAASKVQLALPAR